MAKNVPLLPEERVRDIAQQTQAAQGAGVASQIAQGVRNAALRSAQGKDNIYSGNLNKDLTGSHTKGSGADNGGGGSGAAAGSTPASTPVMQDVNPNNLLANPNIDSSLPQYQFSNDYGVQFNAPTADPELAALYNRAMQTLEEAKGQRPTYGSQYDEQIKSLYDQIMGRGQFKYDSKTDPLYQQYVQDYTQQGKMAMRDTMGRAAALTGGYGSSYAQAVGQQTYDQYLQRMADVLPETYGMALDAWEKEGDQLSEKLATTQELEKTDYNRYLDKLQQHNTDVDRAQTDADTAYNRMIRADETAYGRAVDQYNRDLTEAERKYGREVDEYNRLLQENKLSYDRAMDAYDIDMANRKYNQSTQDAYYDRLLGLMSAGYTPTAEDYANAGLTVAQGEALRGAYAPQTDPEPEVKTVHVNESKSQQKKAEKKAARTATNTANAVNKAVNNIMKHFK